MSQVANIFHSLEGQWNLYRTIKGIGSVMGIAKFQKNCTDNTLLHYREDGIFTNQVEGTSNKIYRDYLYCFQNDEISVFYAEKSKGLLHTLEFNSTSFSLPPITATAKHLCGCDAYNATYEFNLPDEFSMTYAVNGPKKDYIISSIFKRLVPGIPSCHL